MNHWRKAKNLFWISTIVGLAVCVLVPLFLILTYVGERGISAFTLDFFTKLPNPVGEPGGGMAHAMMGSLIVVGIGSLIGIPWGVTIGIYLSEFRHSKLASFVRFTCETLASIPSIVVGLIAYSLFVKPFKHFSGFSGGIALSFIMIPFIARMTEEVLKTVPQHIREAGLALGLPRWKVILSIVTRGSRRGIITACLLGVARISGETAPLIFTAFGNQFWNANPFEPIATLPQQIYVYAISPFESWHGLAWTAALTLLAFNLVINLFVRLLK